MIFVNEIHETHEKISASEQTVGFVEELREVNCSCISRFSLTAFLHSKLFLFGRHQLFSHSRRVCFADMVDVDRIADPVDRFEMIQKIREVLG